MFSLVAMRPASGRFTGLTVWWTGCDSRIVESSSYECAIYCIVLRSGDVTYMAAEGKIIPAGCGSLGAVGAEQVLGHTNVHSKLLIVYLCRSITHRLREDWIARPVPVYFCFSSK